MRALARITTAASTPHPGFRREWVPHQMSSECVVLDSTAGLELLTPCVGVLRLASGNEYLATLDDGSIGRAYAQPGVIQARAAGVRPTTTVSCDPAVVETRPDDTPLFVCLSAVRDR